MHPHPGRLSFLVPILVVFTGLALLLGTSRPTVASAPALHLIAPDAMTPTAGDLIVELHAAGVVNLGGWEATLGYDRSLLTLVGVESAPDFGLPQPDCSAQQRRCAVTLGPRPILGGASVGAISLGAAPGLHGDGLIARLRFQSTGQPGLAVLTLRDALVTDIYGQAVIPQTEGAQFGLGVTVEHQLFLPAVANQSNAGQ